MAQTNTPESRNWLAGRLSKRIDRFWLSGVVAVNVLAWVLLGVQYIATFLIGYFFVFTLCFRTQIKTAFPPDSTHLYADKNGVLNSKLHGLSSIRKKLYLRWVLLGVFGLYFVALVTPWDTFDFSKASLGVLIPNAVVNYYFIAQHRRLFSALNGDSFLYRTGAYRTEKYSETAEYWVSSIAVLRPGGAIIAVLLLWCGVLWAYVDGAEWLFDGNSTVGELIMPAVINMCLFEFYFVALISVEKRQIAV